MKRINPTLMLRLAAGCSLFFAIGHSIGHMTRHDAKDPEVLKTLHSMQTTTFDMFGQLRTFDQNYEGMSLNLIITLLAMTALLWILAKHAADFPLVVKSLLWPFAFVLAGFGVTAWLYFFPVPAITCLLGAILIALAIASL